MLVGPAADWVAVSAGDNHTMGIRSDGSLWGWGLREHGRTGGGITGISAESTPWRVGNASDWVAVSAGGQHSMGIRADGSLWAWGNRADGRLGQGVASGAQGTPIRVGADNDWVAVSAGGAHSMGIRTDGSLWAWGLNWDGRLGVGDTTQRNAPTRVGDGYDWVAVSAGGEHTVGIRADGSFWAWGARQHGAVGDGETAGSQTTPLRIGTATAWDF